MKKIAIIGTGLAGLTAAHFLKDHADITLFEKARGVGGRMATRYADPYKFDHGAQFFTVKEDAFKDFLAPIIKQNIVQNWTPTFAEIYGTQIQQQYRWEEEYPHYVATPNMNALGKYLAKDFEVHIGTRIISMTQTQAQWCLTDEKEKEYGAFDHVILAIPSHQAVALLPNNISFKTTISDIQMSGCYSLMLGFEEALDIPFQVAIVKESDISWISLNHSKPGRADVYAMMVMSTNSWAEAHIEADTQSVQSYLIEKASEILHHDLSLAPHKALHKWRYANAPKRHGEICFYDADYALGVCGDWTIQGRVESAFLSGKAMAETLLAL